MSVSILGSATPMIEVSMITMNCASAITASAARRRVCVVATGGSFLCVGGTGEAEPRACAASSGKPRGGEEHALGRCLDAVVAVSPDASQRQGSDSGRAHDPGPMSEIEPDAEASIQELRSERPV